MECAILAARALLSAALNAAFVSMSVNTMMTFMKVKGDRTHTIFGGHKLRYVSCGGTKFAHSLHFNRL